MNKYNFDNIIDRKGTNAFKTDGFTCGEKRDDIIPLWVADMDFEVCHEVVEAMQGRLNHKVYGYSLPPDSFWNSIISWLKNTHQFEVSKDELTYVPGVMKGFAMAINYFTKPGDVIVIQQPVYHPFKMVIEGNGCVVANNQLKEKDGKYEMDFEGFEQILTEQKPRIFVLCNPHNPIGIAWDIDSLRKIASMCRKHGTLVISDEIHADLALFGNKHLPFATVSEDAAAISITLGAPSKTFNIPGIVSAWCVIKNKELRDSFFNWLTCNEFNDTCFLSTIATETAYTHGAEWLQQAKKYMEGNIEAVEEYCAENIKAIKPIRPEASFLIWLDCRELGLSQPELVDLFVNKAGLGLNNGIMFGKAGEGFMRLNIASPKSVIMKALSQLDAAVRNLQ